MHPEADPDPEWVAALAGSSLARATRAIAEAAAERRLYAHLARQHHSEGRTSYVEIDAPLELYALVRLLRPHHVVEVGVSSGVSSAYLLRAMEANGRGRLHSVDLARRPRPAGRDSTVPRSSWTLPPGRGSGWAVPRGLHRRWDLRLGDKRKVLPLLGAEGLEVSLFVYDVPHDEADAYREFRALDARMPVGGVAIADHGPSGDLCRALRRWAGERGATPVRRANLGLYGFRCDRPASPVPAETATGGDPPVAPDRPPRARRSPGR
jgi:hypothetical protein